MPNLPASSEAPLAALGAPVGVAHPWPGATSLFVVGKDDQVWTNAYPAPARPGEWSGWYVLGQNTFPARAPVTALSLSPGATSLYVVGLDGQVWSNFFPSPDNPGQWSGWVPLGPNTFAAGVRVTALSTAAGATSLYVLGRDGQVWSNFFPSAGAKWNGWFPLGPNTFPHDAEVTALSLSPNATSLYVTGSDGKVWSNAFPAAGGLKWTGWAPLGANVFKPGAPVAALSTGPGATSLYVAGLDGQVWSTYFPAADRPGQWSGWFGLGHARIDKAARVSAVSTGPGATSLYVIGAAGQVLANAFPAPGRPGQWTGWFALGPNVFPAGGAISAASLAPGATGLYIVGLDHQVWTDAFPAPTRPGQWTGWASLSRPPSQLTFDSGLVGSNLPLMGQIKISLNSRGDVVVSGHAHDSGFDNIDYVFTCLILTPGGLGLSFQREGSVEGTTAGLPFGTPNRDDTFIIPKPTNASVAKDWPDMAGATFHVELTGKDTLVGGLAGALATIVEKAVAEMEAQIGKQLGDAVVAAL